MLIRQYYYRDVYSGQVDLAYNTTIIYTYRPWGISKVSLKKIKIKNEENMRILLLLYKVLTDTTWGKYKVQ